MKRLSLSVFVLSSWLMWAVWHDPAEGVFFRPLAFLGILSGVVMFFESFKRDIVDAIKADIEASASRSTRQPTDGPEPEATVSRP